MCKKITCGECAVVYVHVKEHPKPVPGRRTQTDPSVHTRIMERTSLGWYTVGARELIGSDLNIRATRTVSQRLNDSVECPEIGPVYEDHRVAVFFTKESWLHWHVTSDR